MDTILCVLHVPTQGYFGHYNAYLYIKLLEFIQRNDMDVQEDQSRYMLYFYDYETFLAVVKYAENIGLLDHIICFSKHGIQRVNWYIALKIFQICKNRFSVIMNVRENVIAIYDKYIIAHIAEQLCVYVLIIKIVYYCLRYIIA